MNEIVELRSTRRRGSILSLKSMQAKHGGSSSDLDPKSPRTPTVPVLPLDLVDNHDAAIEKKQKARPIVIFEDPTIKMNRGWHTDRPVKSRGDYLYESETEYRRLQDQLKMYSARTTMNSSRSNTNLPNLQSQSSLQNGPQKSLDIISTSSLAQARREAIDIVSTVNDKFQRDWKILGQKMIDSSMGGHIADSPVVERTRTDHSRNFERVLQDMNTMLKAHQELSHENGSQDHSTLQPIREESDHLHYPMRKIPHAKKRPEYLDTRMVKTLIERLVECGLLDPADAPILKDDIPVNSKLGHALSPLVSHLCSKINHRFADFFCTPEWEALHRDGSKKKKKLRRKTNTI